MRRLLVVAVAGASLSGCTSFSLGGMFSPPPPPAITVQLESLPPGADAVTSIGPGCKTPCSVSIPSASTFTVTYSLPRFQPVTVPVSVIVNPGDFTTPATAVVDPNPVFAELQPAVPQRRIVKRAAPVRPRPAPAAAAPAPAGSPFPAPPAASR